MWGLTVWFWPILCRKTSHPLAWEILPLHTLLLQIWVLWGWPFPGRIHPPPRSKVTGIRWPIRHAAMPSWVRFNSSYAQLFKGAWKCMRKQCCYALTDFLCFGLRGSCTGKVSADTTWLNRWDVIQVRDKDGVFPW